MDRQAQTRRVKLPAVTIGVVGHVAHGKTTLTAAITALLSQRTNNPIKPQSPEEIAKKFIFQPPQTHNWETPSHAGEPLSWQGRTSHATILAYQTEKTRVTHFDLPGHVSRVGKIATRAPFLDIAILVVSAQDGIMPQTREHLFAASRSGVSRWVVFLNYCELVPDLEQIDQLEAELRELFLWVEVAPDEVLILRGSALRAYQGDDAWRRPIAALLDEIDRLAQFIRRDEEAPTLFLVERSALSSRRSYGTLIGALRQGKLQLPSNNLALFGLSKGRETPIEARIQNLFRVGSPLQPYLDAGDFAGIITLYRREDIQAGQVFAKEGSLKTSSRFTCRVHLLKTKEGGRRSSLSFYPYGGPRAQFFINGAAVEGAINFHLPGEDPNTQESRPGDEAEWKVELRSDLYLQPKMTFVFSDGSDGLQPKVQGPRRWGGIIGWGEVVSVE